jgi:orotidine-5'-phosphate decarboxylase
VKILENSLKSIKENIKSLQDELVDSRSITNDAKRQKVLQRINKELRSELKKLSENSTTL